MLAQELYARFPIKRVGRDERGVGGGGSGTFEKANKCVGGKTSEN